VTLLAGVRVVPDDSASRVPFEPCSCPLVPTSALLSRDATLWPHVPAACGFKKPFAIQQRAIVPVIKGKDVIAQAQFGTGKTVAFAISILQRINLDDTDCQALILAPTRELAQQIQKVRSCTPGGAARVCSPTAVQAPGLLWLAVGVVVGPPLRAQRGQG